MIDLGLEGKRAIVVGAGFIPETAGPGRGRALRRAQAGATVACIDKDAGRAAAIVAEIEELGGKAFAIIGDVTFPDEAVRVIDEAVATLGGLDVCVDVVGEAVFGLSVDYSNELWDQQLTKNLNQAFHFFTAAYGQLHRQ